MSRPLRIEYPGAFYHVTSRGNERNDIFKSAADREQFLFYLAASCARYGAIIHAYCLMTNHYHLKEVRGVRPTQLTDRLTAMMIWLGIV